MAGSETREPATARPAAARSWAVVAASAVAVVALRGGGCVEPEPEPDPLDGADVAGFLAGVADGLVAPAYDAFAAAAAQLSADAAAWRDAVDGGGDGAAERAAAQASWEAATDLWQGASVLHLGAAAAPDRAGGEALADEVYSWPTVNECLVDQGIADERYADADFFDTSLVNAYGLDALEWLLFAPADETDCPSQVLDPVAWEALGDARLTRRAAYATVAAAGVEAVAGQLVAGWADAGADLASPAEGALWTTEREALQAVYAAAFYVETTVKDEKLAVPLGVGEEPPVVDPEELEHPWAGHAFAAVAANLERFREVLVGPGDAPGLDALLAHVGAPETADAMLAALDEALAGLAALEGDDPAAVLADRPEDARAVYDALKGCTDLLKSDVAVLLVLAVPSEAAGDND